MSRNQVHTPQDHSHWLGDDSAGLVHKLQNDTIHISAKAMHIVWGNDSRFWQWVSISGEESSFKDGAELIQVNWLEVTGSLDLAHHPLSPSRTYEILYKLKFKDDAFGWQSAPVTFEVTAPGGHHSTRKEINLEHYRKSSSTTGFHEVSGGEFSLQNSGTQGKVVFKMSDVGSRFWKGGIVLAGVAIRPRTA